MSKLIKKLSKKLIEGVKSEKGITTAEVVIITIIVVVILCIIFYPQISSFVSWLLDTMFSSAEDKIEPITSFVAAKSQVIA